MLPQKVRILAIGLILAVATFAQNEKKFALTISPIHLALPLFEFTGQYALTPKFEGALIFGKGSITEKNRFNEDIDIPVLELGAQASYYLLGSYQNGMQIGTELLWIKVSLPESEGVTAAANGLAFGPMLGYKWVADYGLTLIVQGGYEYLFLQAKAKDSMGNEIDGSADSGIPLLNLNIGWSF